MSKLTDMFGLLGNSDKPQDEADSLESSILPEHQRAKLERDILALDDSSGTTERRVQKEAERQVQSAAEESLKRLHVVQRGRCPNCGEHLQQHLFATICEACGFHSYEAPRRGPVRIHLRHPGNPVEGERCYVLKNGDVLVMKEDVVTARIPRDAVSWVEYIWDSNEIDQRYSQLMDRLKLACGWCNEPADPEKDGFHLVQTAFGSNQERFIFCSDECYEAFRKMYPARVHRNCYERNCATCDLCIKRYDDENDSVRLIAKDFLKTKNTRK